MAVVGLEDVANSVIEAMKAMEREHEEREERENSMDEEIKSVSGVSDTFSTPCDKCSNQVNSSVCNDCAFYPLSTKDKGNDESTFIDDEKDTSFHDEKDILFHDEDETLVQVPRWFMNFVEDEFDSIDEVLGCMLKDIKKLKKKNKGRSLKESKKKEKKREARIERLEKLLVMLYYELRQIFGKIDEIQELYKDVVDDLSSVMIRLRIRNEDCGNDGGENDDSGSSENIVNNEDIVSG